MEVDLCQKSRIFKPITFCKYTPWRADPAAKARAEKGKYALILARGIFGAGHTESVGISANSFWSQTCPIYVLKFGRMMISAR